MNLTRLHTRFHTGKLEDDKLGKLEMSYCRMHCRYRGAFNLAMQQSWMDGDGVGKCELTTERCNSDVVDALSAMIDTYVRIKGAVWLVP